MKSLAQIPRLGSVLLLLAGLAHAQNQFASCIKPVHSWFDVCDFTTHTCIVSNLFCSPFGTLQGVANTAPIQPSETEPWTLLIDAYNRTDDFDTLSTCYSANNAQNINFDACKGNLTSTSSPTAPVMLYDYGTLVIRHSYLTIKPIQTLSTARVQIQKTVPLTSLPVGPLCRCLEFTGDHISLERVKCDVSKCVLFFQKAFQYKGDDGAMIVFSGASAAFSSVTECDFVSQDVDSGPNANAYADFRAFTTGLRFGADSGTTGQDVDQLRLESNTFTFIDIPIAFWDVTTRFADENITVVAQPSDCVSPTTGAECLVTYKQAYRDATPLYWNASNSARPDTGSGWGLINISAVVPPSYAHVRDASPLSGITDGVSNTNSDFVATGGVWAIVGVLGAIVLLELVYFCRKEHRYGLKTE